MNKKIKICFVISNLGAGGAERQFVELINSIDKSKFSICVCLYAANKGVFFSEIENDVSIKVEKNILTQKIKVLKILEALFYLRRYFINNDFDIVLTALFMNGLLVRVSVPTRYNNKIVYSVRNNLTSYSWYYKIIEKLLISKSFVVTNTHKASQQFKSITKKKYFHRITNIYNGFNLNRFYSNGEKDCNKIIIGNVGRQTYQKNQIQLINVLRTLNQNNFQLQIVGSSGDQSILLKESIKKKSLEEKVILIDKVTNIEDYYRSFDIFVLTSHYEGCPNVLFEAMLSKCFCIISKRANTDDFVIDGENGLVYNGTDEDLEKSLRYAVKIKGSDTFNAICENGYKYAKENFSMGKMVLSYENLFLNILEKYHQK